MEYIIFLIGIDVFDFIINYNKSLCLQLHSCKLKTDNIAVCTAMTIVLIWENVCACNVPAMFLITAYDKTLRKRCLLHKQCI